MLPQLEPRIETQVEAGIETQAEPQVEPGIEAGTGLQTIVQRLGAAAGFAHAGIAAIPAAGAEEQQAQRAYLEQWIEQGHAGEMDYLKRRNALGELLRSSVTAAVPWARSVIVCAAPYQVDAPRSIDPASEDAGWIARYAWSGTRAADGTLRPADYHKVLLGRLKQVESALHEELDASHAQAAGGIAPVAETGSFESWAYVDTGPIIERAWASLAGVGWTGKNTCTLNQQLGSFFFLGVILTSLEVPVEGRATLAADRCGSCTRCIDACPTDALIAPRRMDASRCISYLTIEKRGAIPEGLRAGMGRQVFGCDICQDVCPWNNRLNRKAPIATDVSMEARPELINPSLGWLAQLSEEEFGRVFYGSPVKRAKYAGLRRNVAIAMGNSGQSGFIPQLETWASGEDEVLAETARWALARLGSS
jgi:epoxyqueuosine reductase